MPVSLIPFKMPAPLEIPAHLVAALRQLPPGEAMRRGMELLLQIDAAEVILYERLDRSGRLELGGVVCRDSSRTEAVQELLRQEEFYGKPPSAEGRSLAGAALAQGSALLVMGQAQPGEEAPLPARLREWLLATGGSVGFVYVLPLAGQDKNPLGALTLIRPATAGPLNHDQPGLVEGMRQVLSRMLTEA